MVRRLARGFLALFGLAFALARCTTEDPAPSRADAAADAGPPPLSPECAACVEQECEIPLRACETDPACRAVEGCWTAATSAVEADACLAELGSDAGAAVLGSLARCASAECGTTCPPPPFPAAQVSACQESIGDPFFELAEAPAEYQVCACERCSTELLDCVEGGERCARILGCIITSGCVGEACLAACNAVAYSFGGWTTTTFAVRACMDECAEGLALEAGRR